MYSLAIKGANDGPCRQQVAQEDVKARMISA